MNVYLVDNKKTPDFTTNKTMPIYIVVTECFYGEVLNKSETDIATPARAFAKKADAEAYKIKIESEHNLDVQVIETEVE